jgi:Flp pilus assembly protein TadB
MKNRTLGRLLAISIIIAMASCAGSKKFNYQEAYKFKTIKYSKEKAPEQVIQEQVSTPEIMEASTEPVKSREEVGKKIEQAELHLLEKIDVSKAEASEMSQEDLSAKINQLSSKEKKALRKDLKKDLKEIKKIEAEINDISATSDIQATDEVSGGMRLGIIIGAGGIIGMILAALIGGTVGSIFWVLGGIALIVGLILILIDVV